jgi:hypothetical protein
MGLPKLTAGCAAAGQPIEMAGYAGQIPPARLSVLEAAAYCGVSVSYLNKLRCLGGGPVYITRGRRVIYDTRDLDTWLVSGRRTSTADAGGEA